MAVAYAAKEVSGSRVEAAYRYYEVTGYVTTAAYVDLAFVDENAGAFTNGLIPTGHAISLEVTAKSTTQDSLIKILKRTSPNSDEVELLAETTLTAGTAASVYSDAVRAYGIVIQVKESVAGGTVDVYVMVK